LREQAETQGKERGSPPVGQEAEVADAHKSQRQQVEQKPTQELLDREAHDPLAVLGRVSPPERDLAIRERHQSVIGDSNAVGIGAEVAEDVFRTAKRWLAVDHPILAEQQAKAGREDSWFSEGSELAVELKLAVAKSTATNFPRKTRLSTLTGRKKDRREEIQRSCSGARPPAATTQ
jgi:hypothetical protein